MARLVKHQEYSVKRNEILDAAQRLVYSKGYQRMTIQDILDELHISKGAFYHYFSSKTAVLEALVERMVVEEVIPLLIPIVQDASTPALEKLNYFFNAAGRWKIAKKTFMLELLQVWLADENAIVRQKLSAMSVKRVTPLLTQIIHQGIQEGVLTTSYPDQFGGVVYTLLQSLGDSLSELMLSHEPGRDDPQQLETIVAAYTDALERVLGAPRDSIVVIDDETLKEWFVLTSERNAKYETLSTPGLA